MLKASSVFRAVSLYMCVVWVAMNARDAMSYICSTNRRICRASIRTKPRTTIQGCALPGHRVVIIGDGGESVNRKESASASKWTTVLILFFITSMVESLVMSHVFSFLPLYLTELHAADVKQWVGILNGVSFIVGLPLVPLWGVWANRYSGKAVIVRSAFVEGIVLGVLGLSQGMPMVVLAMALIGFQLGNTGVMLAAIRRAAPNHRTGYAVSLFSVSSAVGAAVGPLYGGLIIAHTDFNLHDLYVSDAALSFFSGLMLLVFYRELRPTVSASASAPERRRVSRDSAWIAAWKSVRTIFTLRITWILFGIYTLLMLARQMINPYVPVAILDITRQPSTATQVIGVLMGITALIGAGITVVAGRLGDAIGFRRVLAIAFAMSAVFSVGMALSHTLVPFGVMLAGYSAAIGIGGAMVFALLSTRVPATHQTTALNLVYLPLYFGGIVGPVISSGLSHLGLLTQFSVAAAIFFCGLVMAAAMGSRVQHNS